MQSVLGGKAFGEPIVLSAIQSTGLAEVPSRLRRRFEPFTNSTQSKTWKDALAEGTSTGHPRMPEFRLEPRQVGDFINFLKPIE